MTCLLFQEYIMNCIKQFQNIIQIVEFNICESEKYSQFCTLNKIIKQKEKG